MIVVLSRSVEGALFGMPFDSRSKADEYARAKAWMHFGGTVDEVEIFRIDETDAHVAKQRVEGGEGNLLKQVDRTPSADEKQREEVRSAEKFLASIGLGSTSIKKS